MRPARALLSKAAESSRSRRAPITARSRWRAPSPTSTAPAPCGAIHVAEALSLKRQWAGAEQGGFAPASLAVQRPVRAPNSRRAAERTYEPAADQACVVSCTDTDARILQIAPQAQISSTPPCSLRIARDAPICRSQFGDTREDEDAFKERQARGAGQGPPRAHRTRERSRQAVLRRSNESSRSGIWRSLTCAASCTMYSAVGERRSAAEEDRALA